VSPSNRAPNVNRRPSKIGSGALLVQLISLSAYQPSLKAHTKGMLEGKRPVKTGEGRHRTPIKHANSTDI
jgi:hypothetical protein